MNDVLVVNVLQSTVFQFLFQKGEKIHNQNKAHCGQALNKTFV